MAFPFCIGGWVVDRDSKPASSGKIRESTRISLQPLSEEGSDCLVNIVIDTGFRLLRLS